MITVELPKGDDPIKQIKTTLEIISEMDKEIKTNKETGLDFSKVSWILPCSALLFSNKILELLNKKAKIKYRPPTNKKVLKWFVDIGFPLGKKAGGKTSVPIRHFPNNSKKKNQINNEANMLWGAIKKKIPDEFGESIQYIIGELSDNIDEHSQFTYASLMAQYFPTKKLVDIGVLDNGVTIPILFKKNGIKFSKDSEALKKALAGKVTTKKGEEMRGYGLKSCKDISTKGVAGELYVISHRGVAIFKSDSKPRFLDLKGALLKGTFLYFRLKKPTHRLDIYPLVEGN